MKTMARVPQVTRTITTTKVNALCINLETTEPFNADYILPRVYKDNKKLNKALSDLIDNDTQKFVQAVSTEVVETLYGMTEQEFINTARILDKETRKPIEN